MVAQNVAFGILALAMVLAAIGVVRTQNVVHAALYLVVVLAGAAAQYILLAAEFVAWVQVLIYIGAVVILFLFGIMLTRAPMGDLEGLNNRQGLPAVVATLALIGTLTALLVDAFSDQEIVLDAPTPTADIATQVFKVYVVPFEAVSILLLAALVGAIVLARRD